MAYVDTEREVLYRNASISSVSPEGDDDGDVDEDIADEQAAAGKEVDRKKTRPSTRSFRFWLLVFAYGGIVFLMAANATALTTMLGPIAASLQAYQSAATWFNASYMIASSCASPLMGRLATIFRPTNLFLGCTTLFILGGCICGSAQNTTVFLLGRAVTGAGAGGLFTTANVLLVEAASVERRGLLIGSVNAIATAGGSLGGVIAGAFAASRYGWRPAFFVQLPIAIFCVANIYAFSPNPRAKEGKRSFAEKLAMIDYLGIFTLCAALVLLLSAAMASTLPVINIVLGTASLLVFILVEARYARYPIIPVYLLTHPPTLLSCLAALFTMSARWTVLFYAPIWSISVLGYHPARAGAALIPTSFGFGVGGLVMGAFSIRHGGGYSWQSIVSMVFFLSTYVIFVSLPLPADTSLYVALLVGNGLATGSLLNFTLAHTLSTTKEKAIVASLFNTFRNLSPSVGAGLAGGIFQRTVQASLHESMTAHRRREGLSLTAEDLKLIQRLKGSPNLVWQLPLGWKRQVSIEAYEVAIKKIFWTAAIAVIIGILLQLATAWRAHPKEERLFVGDDEEEEEEEEEAAGDGEGDEERPLLRP